MPRKGAQEFVLAITREANEPVITTHSDIHELTGRLVGFIGQEIEQHYPNLPWVGYKQHLAQGEIIEAARLFFSVVGGGWHAYHHKHGGTSVIADLIRNRHQKEEPEPVRKGRTAGQASERAHSVAAR